jgi:hypothetical protein
MNADDKANASSKNDRANHKNKQRG